MSRNPIQRVQSSATTTSQKSFVTKVDSNITKKGEFGFPNGHIGYLTEEQEDSLEQFKNISEKAGLYRPASGDKLPSHQDAVLLRYLRARRFDANEALKQFKDTEEWREANGLDNLYANIDVEDYDAAWKHYPQWLGRRDKRGIPLYLYKIGGLDSKTMSAYTKKTANIKIIGPSTAERKKNGAEKTPTRLLPLFALYENLAGFMTQLCTVLTDRPNSEVPITQSNNIVDIANVGLKQFWNLRGHMQDASILATAHYPETLDRIFIVGAPSFFPTVWGWIKNWFDPITVSKIFILSKAQVFPTLSQFIDPVNIPKQYGGKLDFNFGDKATIDPIYADRLTWRDDGASGIKDAKGELRRWPRGPLKWVERDDGDWDLVAIGSVGGKERRDIVATLKVGEDRGGLADESLPRAKTQKQEPISNGVAKESMPVATAGEASNGTATEKETATQTEAPAAITASAPQTDAIQTSELPLRTANGTTLLPMAVPGTAPNAQQTAEVISEKIAPDALPPASALAENIPPVPLAAVAQPLPGETKTS